MRKSSNATSEFIDIPVPRTKAVIHIRRNHEAGELTIGVRTGDHGRDARVTIAPSLGFAVGASVRLEDGADEPLAAALHLGYVTLYFGATGYYGQYHTPDPPPGGWASDPQTGYVDRPKPIMVKPPGLLRRLVHAAVGELKRRKISVVFMRYDDGNVEGAETKIRVTLWDDDNGWTRGKSRQWSLNLTRLLWGKAVQSPEYVVDARDVEVALPEGKYPMHARVLERTISWPRWPLVRIYRGVSFRPACMLVPRRKSSGLEYEGNHAGCESRVEGESIRAGIAALIGRVLRNRESYGGPNWTPKPTPLRPDNHNFALMWVTKPDGATTSDLARAPLPHGKAVWFVLHDHWPAPRQIEVDHVVTAYAVGFQRDPVDGGIHVMRFANSPVVLVDGELVQLTAKIWPESLVQLGAHEFTAYFSPIGPKPPQLDLPVPSTDPPAVDEEAERAVAEVAATLDTSAPGPDEIEPPAPQ